MVRRIEGWRRQWRIFHIWSGDGVVTGLGASSVEGRGGDGTSKGTQSGGTRLMVLVESGWMVACNSCPWWSRESQWDASNWLSEKAVERMRAVNLKRDWSSHSSIWIPLGVIDSITAQYGNDPITDWISRAASGLQEDSTSWMQSIV